MPPIDPIKQRLLEAAGQEFAEKGFEGATVRSICARAGANIAAVNYHFGDKEQLYTRAVIEAHRCGSVEMLPEEEFFRDGPAEQLTRYIKHFLTSVLAIDHDGWHQTLLLREMMAPTSASKTLVEEVIRPRFERLERVLRDVCPEASGRRLHAIAFSIIGQCLFYRMGRPVAGRLVGFEEFDGYDVAFLADHITAFSLAALGLGAPVEATGDFPEGPRTPALDEVRT